MKHQCREYIWEGGVAEQMTIRCQGGYECEIVHVADLADFRSKDQVAGSTYRALNAGHSKVQNELRESRAELDRARAALNALAEKHEVEVAAHRENCVLLMQSQSKLAAAVEARDEMARHFMNLHDSAKRFIGPKVRTDTSAVQLNGINPGLFAVTTEPLPGRAELAALGEDDEAHGNPQHPFQS